MWNVICRGNPLIRREELSGIWRGSIGLAQRRRADEDETEIVPAILCRLLVASYEPPKVIAPLLVLP
jgi:hypothetical protein